MMPRGKNEKAEEEEEGGNMAKQNQNKGNKKRLKINKTKRNR
jgi:hypothetical protein